MNSTALTESSALIRKLENSFSFSDDERNALLGLRVQIVNFARDQNIVRQGDRATRCFTLLTGFSYSFKTTKQGHRQIVAFHVPGDTPDLQSLHLARLDFSINTLTACRVAFIQHDDLSNLCDAYPRIGKALLREAIVEASIGREWILNVGQRAGAGRISHIFCEMLTRLRQAGLSDERACHFPMTQVDLGDATGMTAVHVSRCLKELRNLGLIQMEKNYLKVLDWTKLTAMADFDPLYLHIKS